MSRKTRLAVLVSHPIQHFSPWHRELAKIDSIQLRVFFCCDWGVTERLDLEFGQSFRWDVPLLDGYDYEFLPIERTPAKFGFFSVDNPDVASALDRFSPDVLQIFGYAFRTNWRAIKWARKERRSVLLYSDSNARARSPFLRRVAKSLIVRRFYRGVDGAFVVGDNNRDYHLRYGLPADRLFNGMLPVDTKRLLESVPNREEARRAVRAKHGIPNASFVAMFSGKLSERKRPLDLVMAAQQLAAHSPPIWVVLVGEGNQRTPIEEYLRAGGINNVVLAGFVNQSEIGNYYAAADAIALTSSWDPHPLVVTEAASFGLPAIVADTIGCIGPTDTVQSNVNALIYPCKHVTGLTNALHTLSTDKALQKRLSAAAKTISEGQDVTVAARALAAAATAIRQMGPRY